MNAIENMLTRRSIRAYKSDMVPKEIWIGYNKLDRKHLAMI